MDKITFDRYVEDRYESQLQYYRMAASQNNRQYRRFRWILIILSASTPVMAAINTLNIHSADTTHDINLVVIIISSVVAILTGGLKAFNYQELGVSYRTSYEKLKPEIYYYSFNIGPYEANDIDKELTFVKRVEAILETGNSNWPNAKEDQKN